MAVLVIGVFAISFWCQGEIVKLSFKAFPSCRGSFARSGTCLITRDELCCREYEYSWVVTSCWATHLSFDHLISCKGGATRLVMNSCC